MVIPPLKTIAHTYTYEDKFRIDASVFVFALLTLKLTQLILKKLTHIL